MRSPLENLLEVIGLQAGGTAKINGVDPVIPSRFHIAGIVVSKGLFHTTAKCSSGK